MKYVIGIDQSTQGTKAILVDEKGNLLARQDKKHRQLVNEKGWVSHDLQEIYENVVTVVTELLEKNHIEESHIAAIGISNQRETTAAWSPDGTPIGNAVVWQCARAGEITEALADKAEEIREKTGLPLSPYFPAAKMAWLIQNQIPKEQEFLLGTIDSWLVYKLTNGAVFQTDYSNASRTQLFNLHTLTWDEELCRLFGVPQNALAAVCDSNGTFGTTTLEGYFQNPVPICGVMGDSHGALFAHGCHKKGMVKATYGTGSSIMMQVGEEYKKSSHGLAASLAWGIDGKVSYVLEGNINYTGAVITWLQEDMELIQSTGEIEPAIARANYQDTTVLVPAFSGLSAPHWDDDAKALLYGMSRTTGKAEIIKAAVESIAFQITDVLKAMEADSGIPITSLRVDGGPTKNKYLMQFQSDMADLKVQVPKIEEFSAMGAAYLAGLKAGVYHWQQLFAREETVDYTGKITEEQREEKYRLWQQAVARSQSSFPCTSLK